MENRNPDRLYMWTVYENPPDYPFWYVARLWYTDPAGAHLTNDIRVSDTLDPLRERFIAEGLFMVSEEGHPDPKVLEVWF